MSNLINQGRLYSQKGVALIAVMLIVALAAIIASQMTTRLQMQMQRSVNTSFNQQAYWYVVGAEQFAKRVLITSFTDNKDVTHLEQDWAVGEINSPVDFGSISGGLTDLHSCLNLNALRASQSNSSGAPSAKKSEPDNPSSDRGSSGDPGSNSPSSANSGSDKSGAGNSGSGNSGNSAPPDNKLPARVALENLLVALSIDGVSDYEAEAMADSLTDWLDEDGYISGSGAEDDDYASREFPFLAANHYLASVNELRLIEHFTANIILALKPYVCVLPQSSDHKININTLDEEKVELLQALLNSTLDEAQQVLSARGGAGFDKIVDFHEMSELSTIKLEQWQKDQFVVDSQYFLLKSKADFNDSYFFLNSIIQVKDDEKIQIISRTIGRN
jgi:general secretion pathway protein K